MSEPRKTARNVALILALAAALAWLPGVARAGNVLGWMLTIVMYAALGWFVSAMYRQHRGELYGLGDASRALLYGAVGVAVFALVGASRLWETGAGTLLWFVLVAGASFAVFTVISRAREY